MNDEDDDRDGYENCEDPDCWQFAICRGGNDAGTGPWVPPAPPAELPGEDGPLDPPTHPTTDGSAPTEMPTTPDASTSGDSGQVNTTPCSKYCPNEACNVNDGTCGVPLQFGTFAITAIQAKLPERGPDMLCLDDYCWEQAGCCQPDPAVIVKVNDVKPTPGSVGDKEDETTSTWESTGIEIELHGGAKVDLEAFDSDPENTDAPLQWAYTCTIFVDEKVIEDGHLSCSPSDPDLFITATIAPTAVDTLEDAQGEDQDAQDDMP